MSFKRASLVEHSSQIWSLNFFFKVIATVKVDNRETNRLDKSNKLPIIQLKGIKFFYINTKVPSQRIHISIGKEYTFELERPISSDSKDKHKLKVFVHVDPVTGDMTAALWKFVLAS